jgi:hypothetical protein
VWWVPEDGKELLLPYNNSTPLKKWHCQQMGFRWKTAMVMAPCVQVVHIEEHGDYQCRFRGRKEFTRNQVPLHTWELNPKNGLSF